MGRKFDDGEGVGVSGKAQQETAITGDAFIDVGLSETGNEGAIAREGGSGRLEDGGSKALELGEEDWRGGVKGVSKA